MARPLYQGGTRLIVLIVPLRPRGSRARRRVLLTPREVGAKLLFEPGLARVTLAQRLPDSRPGLVRR